MKAIALARVSSKDQEEGYSPEAQVQRIREYCLRKDLEIVKLFDITESSTRGERKKFKEMIDLALLFKEKVAIVADRVDRIQRSFKDSVLLEELRKEGKIQIHFIRENLIIDETSKATDILMWDFAVMSAKSYVLTLSDNVKTSFNQMIKNGEWIGKPKLGYKKEIDEVTGKKTHIIDKERAYLINLGYELYSTGNYSIKSIAKILREKGLTNNISHKPLSISMLHRILSDPFYIGYMRIKNELYKHNYEIFVNPVIFQRCQDVLASYHKKPFKDKTKDEFITKGLLTCKNCGKAFSPYSKKGHVYIRCTRSGGPCKAIHLREDIIVDQLEKVIKDLRIP